MHTERIITRYQGDLDGPLLIVFGGMHGNEPAGIRALQLMEKMLEVEPITNPGFQYRGTLLGIIGNLRAFKAGQRYINRDLNRMWTPENVARAFDLPAQECSEELLEIKENIQLIRHTIADLQPPRVIVLDLHTTSSYGGIFSITRDEPESVRLGLELHAPVIKGMLSGIVGTTLHYFISENFDVDMVPLTFESGQHDEKQSVNRAIAAITSCMRSIGAVAADDVEHVHDRLLIDHSMHLPKVSTLISKYSIGDDRSFEMLPGFQNFQEVEKGQLLAYHHGNPIYAKEDSMILMPLYQSQGEDGFFLIKKAHF